MTIHVRKEGGEYVASETKGGPAIFKGNAESFEDRFGHKPTSKPKAPAKKATKKKL